MGLRILRWRGGPVLRYRVGSECNHTYPYEREAEGDDPHREDDFKLEQRLNDAGPRDWSDVATGQGSCSRWSLEEDSPRASEGDCVLPVS